MTHIPPIKEFMDKKLFTLHPDTDVFDAIDTLISKGINSAAVVNKEGKLVGILSEKDCLLTIIGEIYNNLPGSTVEAYMTKDVITVGPEQGILSVVDLFLKKHFRRLLVVENDRLIGQITRKDLLRAIMKLKGRKVYNAITGSYQQDSQIGFF